MNPVGQMLYSLCNVYVVQMSLFNISLIEEGKGYYYVLFVFSEVQGGMRLTQQKIQVTR